MLSNKWEEINTDKEDASYSFRLKVPGGWIVKSYLCYSGKNSVHQIFIKDENHLWRLK